MNISLSTSKKIYICGIDEAGRGPLAGPVAAGAVILSDDFPVSMLNDSKKLSEKKRDILEPLIKKSAIAWGVGLASNVEIDDINILQATLLAMKRAFTNMMSMFRQKCAEQIDGFPDSIQLSNIEAIIDGISYPDIPVKSTAEPKADGKYPPVMAASILAKTCRDRIMLDYAKLYPEYGYDKHKGYPVPAHKEVCRRLGPSPIQRLSFKY